MNEPSSPAGRQAILDSVRFDARRSPVAGSSCGTWRPSCQEPKVNHQLPLASVNGAGSMALKRVVHPLVVPQEAMILPASVHGPLGFLPVASAMTASAPLLDPGMAGFV